MNGEAKGADDPRSCSGTPLRAAGADAGAYASTSWANAARLSVVALRTFDLEQCPRNRCVVGREAIQLSERRRSVIAVRLGDHHRQVSVSSRFSRSTLDAHSRTGNSSFTVDVDGDVTATR